MPRPARTLEEGRIYHVYNRVGGDGVPFVDEALAARFVQLTRLVVERDGLVVFAWVLMGNHFHLVVQMSAVPLSRSMKTLQQEVTRTRNRRAEVCGPLWQGRYKAKHVDDQGYLGKLIAYVHLNPVTAGIAAGPNEYRWSGHRDVLGLRKRPIVSVDDVLGLYGASRRAALGAYRSALCSVGDSAWSEKGPGHLPWWPLGRPSTEDKVHSDGGVLTDELGRSTSPYRARLGAEAWLEMACCHLGVQREDLESRSRRPEFVRSRDLVSLIGVERYGVKVKELAASLGKSEDGVSLSVRRGARRRAEDEAFAVDAEALDACGLEER